MIQRNSRYHPIRSFDLDEDGNKVFAGVLPREPGSATGLIEHVIGAGDRADLLARHYYNDDRLWWRIADANPQITFAGELATEDMTGAILLIPKAQEA